MKQLILLILSVFFFPSSDPKPPEPIPTDDNIETIYLGGDHLRSEITLEKSKEYLQVCNLKIGQAYAFSIYANSSCQPLILKNWADNSKRTVRFKAAQSCEQFIITTPSGDGDCNDTFRISILNETANKKGGKEKASLEAIQVDSASVEELVRDVLIGGDCFDVTNVKLTGGIPRGIGKFSSGMTSLGLERGIMLSTGEIENALGPNESTGTTGMNDGLMGESDLEMLLDSGAMALDYTIIEFDFVPTESIISFRYVFASEEYCDFVNDIYNDVFGFFISGPGITGPFSGGAKNIALIPGTATPVAINNVNFSTNPSFYLDNVPVGQMQDPAGDGCTTDELGSMPVAEDDIEYDGFTTVLVATDTIIPCETYHIKLAIADIGDDMFDSAVFLEGNSFDAGGDVAAEAFAMSADSNLVYETCTDGAFIFNRVGGDVSIPLTVNYTVSGTATPGVDYVALPASAVIPVGETMVSLPVDVMNDGMVEGPESIILDVEAICRCDSTTVTLFIDDVAEMSVELDGATTCFLDTTLLEPAVTGGASSTYTYNWSTGDSTSSIAVSPVATTSYTVTVTDICGTESIDSADVVVSIVDVVATNNGPVCVGFDLEFMATVTGGTPPFTYSWIGPNGFTSMEANPVVPNATSAESGFYTVFVSDSLGCEASMEVEAIVYQNPSITASSNSPICEGEDLLLMADVIGKTPTFTFDWAGPNAFASSDQNPVITGATSAADGVYTVMVTDENGCVDSTSVTVVVNAGISVDVSSNSPICEGADLELTATPTSGTPDFTYSWTGPNGFISTDQNPVIAAATPDASGSYTVMVTDANGCNVTDSLDVTIYPAPTVTASNNGPICEGADLELMSEAIGGTPDYTYSWSGPGGFASSEQNPTISAATTGASGTYVVMVTDSLGCSALDSTDVVVNPNPTLTASNNGPICAGEDLELTSEAMGGSPGYTYSWNGPNGFTSMEQNPTIPAATTDASGTYDVMVTDTNGCVASANTEVTVHPNPTVTASNNGPICEGEDLLLTSDAMGGTPNYTFDWSGPGGYASTQQNPTITNVMTGASGTYTVRVTDDNGCTAEATTEVTVNPNPTVTASSNSPICDGDHLYLTAEASGGTGPYSYSWDRLNGPNAIKQNPTVFDATFADAGDYSVTVTDANGCTASSTTTVVINANIDDPGIIAGDEYFCGPGYDPAPITSVTLATGPGPIEYFWMVFSASSNNWEIIPGATGTTYDPGVIYETTLYSRCARRVGCVMAFESNNVTKTVGDEVLTNIDGPTSTCVDDLEDFSVPAQMGATYSWDFGFGATPQFANSNAVTVSWNTMGVRTIMITVSNGTCTASNILPIFVSDSPVYCGPGFGEPGPGSNLGVENGSNGGQPAFSFDESAFQVYPNPFRELVNVKFNQPEQGQTKFQITNMQGQLLKTITLDEGNQQTEIDMAAFSPGIYILTLDLGKNGIYHKKVVKQ